MVVVVGQKRLLSAKKGFSQHHISSEKKPAVSKWQFQGKLNHHCSNHVCTCGSPSARACNCPPGSASSKKCVCSQITRRSLMLDWAFIAKIITAREGWTASSRQWIFAPSIVAFSKEHSREIFYGINCHRERKMECPWSESIICDLFLFGKFFQKGHAPPYVPKVKETFFLT